MGMCPLGAWLFRIARNAVIDFHRRQRASDSLDLIPELPAPSDGDPERQILQREALTRLQTLIAGLDAGKRELMALRFAGGLTAREIACVVGGSEAAIKKRLSRTLQALKEQYSHDQE